VVNEKHICFLVVRVEPFFLCIMMLGVLHSGATIVSSLGCFIKCVILLYNFLKKNRMRLLGISTLLMAGCLEKTTGIPQKLDPRFFASDQNRANPEGSDPNSGGGGGSADPFSSFSGDTIQISGEIFTASQESIDIDFRIPDPSSPGGMSGQGKLLLDKPGTFSLAVPQDLGLLEIQAFQDLEGDGPTGDDPFAQVELQIKEEDIVGISIQLVAGARMEMQHTENPAPKEGAEQDADGIPENPDPFVGYKGNRITLSGKLICEGCPRVDLDLFQPDENAPGGRRMIGKMKLPPGEYVLDVPQGFGYLILEAFVDYDADGPGEGDRMGSYLQNPIQISRSNLDDIDIELVIPEDGRMPMAPQPPQ